jgi:heme oxygenase (biliverdin-IX-beta and delta-forming)
MKGLRGRLAEATRAAHERMHGHEGFAAAASGRLDAGSYRDLLSRLLGFHRPFEVGFARAPDAMARAIALPERARAPTLEADLRALGGVRDVEAVAQCDGLPSLSSEPQWLGALYVGEGSTLGGAPISRALERAGFQPSQRGYFESYGARRSLMWRNFLDRLERIAEDSDAADEAAAAAVAQFNAFEAWMKDWRGASAPALRQPIAAAMAVCAR